MSDVADMIFNVSEPPVIVAETTQWDREIVRLQRKR